jgi:DNA primase
MSTRKTTSQSASDLAVKLSNPDKVFWPEEGYTKQDLTEFYAGIFPLL